MLRKTDWADIEERLKKVLNEKRYRHVLGVTYTACALAMRYHANVDQARLAGLLHDCAKCYPKAKLFELIEAHEIPVTEFERNHPTLLHAKVGSRLAYLEYGVDDAEVAEAIAWHTTGKPEMSLLEKILFVADYIEPNRDRAPRLKELRELAFQNLDHCIYLILTDTIEYLSEHPENIDTITYDAWEYYETGRYFA